MQSSHQKNTQRLLKRHSVSDEDGTREGGLVFPIVFILGFIAASLVHPVALSSFWVWFVLLMLSAAVAAGVQRAVARLNGFAEDGEDA
ncbi:MAG: hypothetical protein AAF681_12945 [Pseudomonadota bacterium]